MSDNNNALEGLRCPICGEQEPFEIYARTRVVVHDSGITDMSDAEWDDDSLCHCMDCGFEARLLEFRKRR